MAFCSKCGTQIPEGSAFCPSCGAPTGTAPAQQAAPAPAPVQKIVYVNPKDHTKDYEKEDIASGKAFSIAAFILPALSFVVFYLCRVQVLFGGGIDWLRTFLGVNNSSTTTISVNISILIAIGVLYYISKDSKYAAFNIKQALKLQIINLPLSILSLVPFVGWPVSALISLLVAIFSIIGTVNALGGKAVELPLVGNDSALGK